MDASTPRTRLGLEPDAEPITPRFEALPGGVLSGIGHYLLMVFGSGRASPQLSVSSRAGVPTAAGRATIPTGEPHCPNGADDARPF